MADPPSSNDGQHPQVGQDVSNNKPPVRPIQMGELIRKFVCRRILQATRGQANAACLGARQWGVGAAGGMEGIVHTHKTVEALYFDGELPETLAAVQVDAENCFGLLEWSEIRKTTLDEAPDLAAAVTWKHAQASFVEQPDLQPQSKDRGAEQGDTYGPVETGLTLGRLSRDTRLEVHSKQMTAELPWSQSDNAARDEAERDFSS
eukprot:12403553-Karenia_brevis.AAC.1